ncbi:MAG: hypothetical protein QOG58_4542 [Caballeronia sp.]|jgi:hypothetical protein|nr:hypothetical protein [Caballeronia sp.]
MAYGQRWRDRKVQLRIGSMVALLVLLALNVFVVPFTLAPDSAFARIVRDVLLSMILLSGVATVSDHHRLFMAIALVAGVAILVRWTGWLYPPGKTPGLLDETALFSLGILCVVIGIKVFSPGTVTFDRILGAVVLYVLIGVVWAEACQLISIRVPGAYAGIAHDSSSIDRSSWIYFSFVTLTTVGYGDITPVAHAARSLAILEALIGQLYPAIVLARLVSLHVAGSGPGSNQA